jgi:hypothetical protein
LAYLVMENRPIRRDTVAILLWPNRGQSAARRNLRTCLHEIKYAPPEGTVMSGGDALRLAKPLQVLRTASTDRPGRHQSLIKAIDWSYSLLDQDQRVLFCSLSVFAEGFDLSAVEHVCRPGRHTPVEQTLQALVEKNLVQRRAPPPCKLLETSSPRQGRWLIPGLGRERPLTNDRDC